MNSKKLIIICSWLLVIIWMIAIFWLSNMDGNLSRYRSIKTINKVIESTVETTNKVGITDKHPSVEKVNDVSKKLNYPLRKIMHMGEYLILSLLLLNALYQSGVRGYKLYLLSIIICFMYACSDEYHQLFVGRTGQFSDVLIDTCGSLIGNCLYSIGYLFYKKIARKN